MKEKKIFEYYLDRVTVADMDIEDDSMVTDEHVPEIGEYDFTIIIYTNLYNMSSLPDNCLTDYTVPIVKRYQQLMEKFSVIEDYSSIFFLYNGLCTTLSRETEKEYIDHGRNFLMQFGFNGHFRTFRQVFSFISGLYYATKRIGSSLKLCRKEKEDYVFADKLGEMVPRLEKTYYPQMKKAKEWPDRFANIVYYANFMVDADCRKKVYQDICQYYEFDNAQTILNESKKKDHMMRGHSKELKITGEAARKLKNTPIDLSVFDINTPYYEQLKQGEFMITHTYDPENPSTFSIGATNMVQKIIDQIDPNHENRFTIYYNLNQQMCFCVYLGLIEDKYGHAYEIAYRMYSNTYVVKDLIDKLQILYRGTLPVQKLLEQFNKIK